MAAQDDGLAALGQSFNQVFDFPTPDWIKAGSGFVQDHQSRVINQRLGQTNAPLHPFGEFAHCASLRLVKPYHLKQLIGPFPALAFRQFEQIPEEFERLARVEIAIEIRFFGQITDQRFGRDMARRVAKYFDMSSGWMQQSKD